MRDATGLFAAALVVLLGKIGGMQPSSGYCIENQCFTLFPDQVDFAAAQDQCADHGGHLMTVRSSVSHDLLVLLLGNTSGGFWLGLRLPSGCPDAAAELRGFQWVTKDGDSDFFNWAPGFDDGCSSHRCVSVSKASDFKWTQTPCDERAAGFLCESVISDPCKSLAFAHGESVAYRTPLGFGGEDGLSWPPGSTAVRRPDGTKYLCASGQWLQGPWTCEVDRGGCEYKCRVNARKEPSCSCPPGRAVSPVNRVSCQDAADDPCVALRCEHDCEADGGTCACDSGFKLADDGRSCEDFDECADRRQCPGKDFVCVNTVGGFKCVCGDGFQLRGGRCVDEDECVSAPCEHVCVNTAGGYRCSCHPGYKVDAASPDKCELHCGTEECRAECDPNDESQCYCPRGYISEERDDVVYCMDIDECYSEQCEQRCVNTFGSYVCACNPGFTLEQQFKCVKDPGVPDTTAAPGVPATSPPGPTGKPPAVSVGGLVGIIVCAVAFVVLVFVLVHRAVNRRGKTEGKARGGETHSLDRVTTDGR